MVHTDPGARASRLRRDIMSRTEPAMLDMWGSEWAAREAYELQPTAQRYEQYEVAFAAKVRRTCGPHVYPNNTIIR